MKTRKVDFLKADFKNCTLEDAEKEVLALFKAAKELQPGKIDVKIVFSEKREVKPWDLV